MKKKMKKKKPSLSAKGYQFIKRKMLSKATNITIEKPS